MTPSNSALFKIASGRVVAQTTAWFLSLPVAKAFGAASTTTYTFGIGKPAVIERFSTLVYKSKYSSLLASLAPASRRTILSENQYEKKFIRMLKATKKYRIFGLL